MNRPYQKSNQVVGLAFIQSARSSTPSSILFEAGVPGGCCLATCLPGKLFITTIAFGGSMAPGERIHRVLREKLRGKSGRDPQPSAGVIDSQSVKTTGVGGAQRGFDGGKKISGRKRHLLVDTQGLVLKARVHSAAVMDRDGVELLLEQSIKNELPGMKHVWLDGGYKGEGKGKQWIEQHIGWSAEIVQHPPKPRGVWAREGEEIDWSKIMPPPGFRVLPRRWVVERTFSWLSQSRRLSKDYERLTQTSESMIYAAMTRLMIRRLAKT